MDACARGVGFAISVPRVLSSRKHSPATSPRRRKSIAVCTLEHAQPQNAISFVDKLYGDDEDPDMEYHRWRSAQDEIEKSGLGKTMPAKLLTYGEFDLGLFCRTLSIAQGHAQTPSDARTFVDIGSGYGRLVFSAAGLLPDWKCVGVEIVPGLSEAAEELRLEASETPELKSVSSRVRFLQADYTELGTDAERVLKTAAIAFCYATTWSSSRSPYLSELSGRLGTTMRTGAVVATVDKQLVVDEDVAPRGARFQLIESITGPNYATGESSVYIYRLRRDDPVW